MTKSLFPGDLSENNLTKSRKKVAKQVAIRPYYKNSKQTTSHTSSFSLDWNGTVSTSKSEGALGACLFKNTSLSVHVINAIFRT